MQMSWQFPSGYCSPTIRRIPPYSQNDIYVVIKSQNEWLVAAHCMQEKKSWD